MTQATVTVPREPTEAERVKALEAALLDALDTIERICVLTPFRANASDAQDLHCSIRAIGLSAIDRLDPTLSRGAAPAYLAAPAYEPTEAEVEIKRLREGCYKALQYLGTVQQPIPDRGGAIGVLTAALASTPAGIEVPAVLPSREAEFVLYEVRGDEEMEAAGSSGPRDAALREIMHYAAVYGQDGPVRVEEVVRIPILTPSTTQDKVDD